MKLASFASLLVCLIFTAQSHAQLLESAWWVGQEVVTKGQTPLRSGDKVVHDNKKFAIFKVEQQKGEWLFLVDEDIRGWAKVDEVLFVKEAYSFFDNAIKKDPFQAISHTRRGISLAISGDLESALADFEVALKLDPSDTDALRNRGWIRHTKNEPAKALADINECIKMESGSQASVELYGMRGNIWHDMREYDKAIADQTQYIKGKPTDYRGYINRGISWCSKKEFDKAIADANAAIRLRPEHPIGYVNRGLAWSNKKDYDRAIADFSEAIKRDLKPPPPDGDQMKAVFDGDGSNKLRTASFDHLGASEVLAMAYNNRGQAWSEKKAYDKAIADFDEVIRLKPDAALGYGGRAGVWRRKKEYDRALADGNEAIRLAPNFSEYYRGRAWTWLGKKAYEQARADYAEAIKRDSKNRSAYDNQAWLWATCPDAKFRNGKKAVESALHACALGDWKESSNISTLAAAYAEVGDFAQAVKLLERAEPMYVDDEQKKLGARMLKLFREKKPYRDMGETL